MGKRQEELWDELENIVCTAAALETVPHIREDLEKAKNYKYDTNKYILLPDGLSEHEVIG